MAITNQKISVLAGVLLVSLLGCNSFASDTDPEAIYDLASRMKHVATSVDGLVKFGDGKTLSKEELLLAAVKNDPTKLEFLDGYTTNIKVEGNNTAILLCKDETAVIEDTGCTAESDVHHWKADQPVACSFTLNLDQVCQ